MGMNNSIVFIQARTNSSRLPRKIFLEFGDQTMLQTVVGRVHGSKKINGVVVLTSDETIDDAVEIHCKSFGVEVFRGPLDDVLTRYYQAAQKYNRPNAIVRVTADCPFIDPAVIDSMLDNFFASGLDYLANTAPPPGTFPDGLDVEIFTFDALEKAYIEARLPSEREHVTFYFWKSGKFKTSRFDLSHDYSNFRFTIDYKEDYNLLSPIHKELSRENILFNLDSLIKYVTDNKTKLPSNRLRNKGWEASKVKDQSYIEGKGGTSFEER